MVKKKVGENDAIFGSVTAQELVDAIRMQVRLALCALRPRPATHQPLPCALAGCLVRCRAQCGQGPA